MASDSDEILDRPSLILQTDSVDFDLKMVRGLGLTYFIYGLVYWIQIKEFLVPLPVVFILVPFAGMVMFFRSIQKWMGSFILLLLPVLVVKDLTIYSYPNLTGVVLLLTFFVWSFWAWWVFYKEEKKDVKSWIFAVSQSVIWFVWLVKNPYLNLGLILVLLIGITVFVRKYLNEDKMVHHVRVGLLIQLVIVLFLLQQFSYISVA